VELTQLLISLSWGELMKEDRGGQAETACDKPGRVGIGFALVVPNPKLKLLDPVREVLRLKHYALRTERCYCDWIGRYLRFHGMRSREELLPGTEKVEQFLKGRRTGTRCWRRAWCRPCGSIWSRCD
jgi:hypothetical protein